MAAFTLRIVRKEELCIRELANRRGACGSDESNLALHVVQGTHSARLEIAYRHEAGSTFCFVLERPFASSSIYAQALVATKL